MVRLYKHLCTLAAAISLSEGAQPGQNIQDGHQILSFPHRGNVSLVTELDNFFDVLDVNVKDVVVHVLQGEGGAANLKSPLLNLEHEVTVRNLKDVIPPSALGKVEGASYFESFQTYEDIHARYAQLCEAHPDILSYEVVGKSIEGRDIISVTLSSKSNGPNEKLQMYFQGLIHAREWLSGATLQYVFEEFVTNYGTDEEVTRLIDEYEIIFIPVVNPDGYTYTWESDRTWRKNRRVNANSNTFGVDLNRNWNTTVWGDSPTNPGSDSYQGPGPKSEPEVLLLSDYFMSLGRCVTAIDFHTYGQLVNRPWGHTTEVPVDEALLKAAGDGFADTIEAESGLAYVSQNSIDLYRTTGTAKDWWYDDEPAKLTGYRAYGYVVELYPRTAGQGGFYVGPEYIIPTGNDIFKAMKFLIDFSGRNPIAYEAYE